MLYEMTVPQFIKMLSNTAAILDKATAYAEVKKFDTSVYLQSRLAPDQFAFSRQIQITCDTAKKAIAQLTGKEAPVNADDETTMSQLRARIESTMSFLETISERDFADAATRKVTTPRWDGQHMTGLEFVIHHALPNFYFHLTTAYAILRHNGVDIGKKDYLGKLPLKR